MAVVDDVKTILDITDSSQDNLLTLYSTMATDYIFDYCQVDEIPTLLNSVLVNMVVFDYRNRGVENVQSEGKGSLSESYITKYPSKIMDRLNAHRKVKVL